jgi:CHAD domain-containing protein
MWKDDHGGSLAANRTVLREHLLESLKERSREYRKALKRCRKRRSEQAVHQLRVQLRRLLAMFEILTCLIPREQLQKAQKKLKKRLDGFDELRDTHVQLLYTAGMLRNLPELKPLYKKLQRREQRLLAPAAKRARNFRRGWLERAMGKIKRQLKLALSSHSVRSHSAEKILELLESAFKRVTNLRQRIDPKDLPTIHRTRIAFKQFRYVVELLQPLLPAVKPQQLVAMDNYQTMMGDIQDIEVIIEGLERLLQKKKLKRAPLLRFQEVLLRRRELLVAAYLDEADELLTFWPPGQPDQLSALAFSRAHAA